MSQPISIPIARHLREPYLIVQTPKMIAQSKGSPRKIVRSPQPARVSDRIARAMFGAPSALRTEAERRRARLLAAFDVVAGVPLLFGAIQVGLLDPQPGEAGVAWLLAGGAAWALCAYLLSRTGQLRIAAGLTIALLWLAPATYLGIEAHHGHAIAPWTAAWLAIPILVAGGIARPATIVVAASGAIVALADLDTLEVEVDVAESNVAKLGADQPAEVSAEAFPDRKYKGRLRQVIPTADRTKATVQVKVTILDKDKDLKPEMSARVQFLEKEAPAEPATKADATTKPPMQSIVSAPESALVTRDGKTVAFEVLEGKVKMRQVEVAGKSSGTARIKTGLYGGETLVDSPPKDLKDGDSVRPKAN